MNIETIYEGKIGVNNLSPQHPLDVSGSVNITGNLSIDTNTFFVDASNNRVGIGTAAPSTALEIKQLNSIGTELGYIQMAPNPSYDSSIKMFRDISDSYTSGIGRIAYFCRDLSNNPTREVARIQAVPRGPPSGFTNLYRRGDLEIGVCNVSIPNGNLGIGVTDVSSSSIKLSLGPATSSSIDTYISINADNSAGNTGIIFNDRNVEKWRIRVDNSNNDSFFIQDQSTNRVMTLLQNGNVGINQNSPSTTLDVSGTGNVTGNFTVDTNTLFVDASNNRVGVCTINTNPFSKLTVNSDDSTAAISINRYNKDGPAYLYFRATDGSEGIPTSVTGGRTIGNINFAAYDGTKFIGSVAAVAANVDSGSVGSTNMPGNLRFYTRPINDVSDTNTALNSFERIRITSTGNVGIGTATPSSTLDVSGTANITGNFTVDTNALFVDASNNRVGIGTITPAYNLVVSDNSNSLTKIGVQTTAGTIGNFAGIGFGTSGFSTNLKSAIGHITTASSNGIGALIFANNSTADATPASISDEKMRITSAGNVGIGTTTPNATLDVSGTANITGNLSVDTNTLFVDASNNRVGVGLTTPANTLDVRGITRITNDDGNSMLYVNSINPTGISATILNALINSGAGYGELQTRGSIQTFYTTTNERMRITNSGDVGVGTTTPETRLDVVGNSIQCSNQGRFKGWYSGGQGSGLATEIGTLSGEGYINTYDRTAGTYGPLNLVAGSSANIKLLTNGNVGIGTNAPNYKLHVEGSGTANEIVGWFNNQGAFSSSIAVRQASKTAFLTNHNGLGTPNYDGQLSNAISFGVSSGASPIQFWNGNTGVGSRGTAKMTILENGNVGIGTNAPAYPLDVSGSSKFTTIRDSANLTGTSGQVLSSTGGALSWITPSVSTLMAVLRERTNFGVASTITFPATANSRVSRNINDIQYNTLGITNVAPNFTIPGSGTFKIVVRANFVANWNGVDTNNNWGNLASRVYLRDESNNVDEVLVGETCVGATTNSNSNNSFGKPLCQGVATLTGVFTQTSTKLYSIQQITNTIFSFGSVQPTKTGGSPSSTATTNPEYYVNAEITKIA